MSVIIQGADLFCGGGGTTTGLMMACKALGLRVNLHAINHWDIAIETHSSNYPDVNHLCTGIDNVDPRKLVKGGRLHILVASPECIYHSNARGGRPINDQSRASAWSVVRWAEALYIDNLLIENVREFQNWGPVGVDGRPLKRYRGQTFQAFLSALRSLGYNVDHKVLNAADYGDPTTRERLFIIARRNGRKINWPKATHGDSDMFSKLLPWKAAKGIIDPSLKGESIFRRKRPLAPSTLARIETGLRRFGGDKAEPFLVILRKHGETRSIDEPLPTITAGGGHFGLVEPFLIPQGTDNRARSLNEPLNTLTTTSRGIALVEPFIVAIDHTGGEGPSRVRSLDEPLGTITGKGRYAKIDPFLIRYNGGKSKGGTKRVHSIDAPVPTLGAAGNQYALVEPFIVESSHSRNGTGVFSLDEPLRTITTKDRFALVETDGYRLDIHFRMLQPNELAKAMSFPDEYHFAGNKSEIVKQIGNAVPINLAEALCTSLLKEYKKHKAA